MKTRFKITTTLLLFGLSAISAPQVFSSNAAEEADVFAGKKFIWKDNFSKNIPQWKKHIPNFQGKPHMRGLQFGMVDGRSVIWALKNYFNGPKSTLKVVNSGEREDLFRSFKSNLSNEIAAGNIKPICSSERQVLLGDNLAILNGMKPYDFIYLYSMDDLHDSTWTDTGVKPALLAWDLLDEGGIFIVDDYNTEDNDEDVRRTTKYKIDKFLDIITGRYEILHKGEQIHIQKHPLKIPVEADASASASSAMNVPVAASASVSPATTVSDEVISA